MDEVIDLETEIAARLPNADEIAGFAADAGFDAAVADAHDILCNSWRGPGERLDKLRRVADALRGFA